MARGAVGAAQQAQNDGAARAQDGRLRARKWADMRKQDAEGWAQNGQGRAAEAGARTTASMADLLRQKDLSVGEEHEHADDEGHRHLQSFRPGRTVFVAAQQAVAICKGSFTQGRRMVGQLGTNLQGWVTGSAFTGLPRRMSGQEEGEEEGHRHLAAADRGQAYKQKGEKWAQWGAGRAGSSVSSAQDNGYMRDTRKKQPAASSSLLTGWFNGAKDQELGASPYHDPDERVYGMKLFAEMVRF